MKCLSPVKISVTFRSWATIIVVKSVKEISGLSRNIRRKSKAFRNRAGVISSIPMDGDVNSPRVKRATSSKGRRRKSKLIVSSRTKFVVKTSPEDLTASAYVLEAAWCDGSLESSSTSHPHVSMRSFTRDSYHKVLHRCFGKGFHRIRCRSLPGTDRDAPGPSSNDQSFAGERRHF